MMTYQEIEFYDQRMEYWNKFLKERNAILKSLLYVQTEVIAEKVLDSIIILQEPQIISSSLIDFGIVDINSFQEKNITISNPTDEFIDFSFFLSQQDYTNSDLVKELIDSFKVQNVKKKLSICVLEQKKYNISNIYKDIDQIIFNSTQVFELLIRKVGQDDYQTNYISNGNSPNANQQKIKSYLDKDYDFYEPILDSKESVACKIDEITTATSQQQIRNALAYSSSSSRV